MQTLNSITDDKLDDLWREACRDDWHLRIVGSEVRGLIVEIKNLRQHTDDQARELDECRKQNAELERALHSALGGLCACRYVSPIDGELLDAEIKQIKALLYRSQPHRPEPATPAGKL